MVLYRVQASQLFRSIVRQRFFFCRPSIPRSASSDSTRCFFKKLGNHSKCEELNVNCRLRNSLNRLDQKIKIDQECVQHRKIKDITWRIACAFSDGISLADPRFKTSVHSKGSSFNSLKIGRSDEFDFMFELLSFPQSKQLNIRLIPDSDKNHSIKWNDSWKQSPSPLDHCYQLMTDSDARLDDVPFVKTHKLLGPCLSATLVKRKFKDLLSTGLGIIPSHSLASNYNIRETRLCYHKDRGFVLAKIPSIDFLIKIDITLCLRLPSENGTEVQLIPSLRYDTWKVSNDDPKEIWEPKVATAIRVMKAIREMAHGDYVLNQSQPFDAPKPWTGDVYFVFRRNPISTLFQMNLSASQLITRYFLLQKLAPCNAPMPSYAITGTVVNLFRQNPDISLCDLVIQAMMKPQFVNHEGSPLLVPRGQIVRVRTFTPKFLEVLLALNESGEKLERAIRKMLPPWYTKHQKPLSISLESSTKDNPTVFHWEGLEELKSPVKPPGYSFTCHKDPVYLYKLPLNDLLSLLYEYPWFKDNPVTLKCLETEKDIDDVYVAVAQNREIMETSLLFQIPDGVPEGPSVKQVLCNLRFF